MSDLTDALWAALDVLDGLGIPYVVMGGLAVRVYGVPRPTYDVDFTITLDRDCLPNLYEALEDAGFTVPDQFRSGWVDQVAGLPLVKFRLYQQGFGTDIDVFLAETLYQEQVLARRVSATISARTVYIVTAEDLILLKLLANRPRDYIDIADVRFMRGELDVEYLRTWARQIGVEERLERVLAESPL